MSNPSSSDRPLVSVVLPVYNDSLRLEQCLNALRAQSWPRAHTELLVVDNGSQENIAQLAARFAEVKLLHEPAPGSYAARNAALKAARGTVFAFTDADCLPNPDWLESGVAALLRAEQQHGAAVAVGGQLELFARHPAHPSWIETYELCVGFDQKQYVQKHHYSATANCFATRRAFELAGPFNAELRSGGDREWGQRAHAAGVTWTFAPEAIVRHPARAELRELLKKRRRQVGGQWRTVQGGHGGEASPSWRVTAQLLARAARPPVARVVKAWRTPAAGAANVLRPLQRAGRVAAVAGALSIAGCVELCRLHLGKTPDR